LEFLEWDASEQILSELEIAWKEYRQRSQHPSLLAFKNFEEFMKSFPELVKAIRSMVGDDEVITSNSIAYNVLCVLIGTIAARIKISWSDVGFSKELYNYAEGWIFLPPSTRSSFESVNKYAPEVEYHSFLTP
jgi:hypothetical protein